MKARSITRRKLQDIDRRLAALHDMLSLHIGKRRGRPLSLADWESAEELLNSIRNDLALLMVQPLKAQPEPDPDLKVWTIRELMALPPMGKAA